MGLDFTKYQYDPEVKSGVVFFGAVAEKFLEQKGLYSKTTRTFSEDFILNMDYYCIPDKLHTVLFKKSDKLKSLEYTLMNNIIEGYLDDYDKVYAEYEEEVKRIEEAGEVWKTVAEAEVEFPEEVLTKCTIYGDSKEVGYIRKPFKEDSWGDIVFDLNQGAGDHARKYFFKFNAAILQSLSKYVEEEHLEYYLELVDLKDNEYILVDW